MTDLCKVSLATVCSLFVGFNNEPLFEHLQNNGVGEGHASSAAFDVNYGFKEGSDRSSKLINNTSLTASGSPALMVIRQPDNQAVSMLPASEPSHSMEHHSTFSQRTQERPASERIGGTAGNDRLLGTNGNDRVFGGGGDDILIGNGGDDVLQGDATQGPYGTNILYGGLGNDTLVGGVGTDHLYFYSANEGVDTVTHFEGTPFGQGDRIHIHAAGFGIATAQYDAVIYDSNTKTLYVNQTPIAVFPNDGVANLYQVAYSITLF